MKSAVVTGIGSVSPQGRGTDSLHPLIEAGILTSEMLPKINSDLILECTELEGFKCLQYHDSLNTPWLTSKHQKRLNRVTRLALASTEDAIADAGFSPKELAQSGNKTPWGISYGSALAGFSNAESVHQAFLEQGKGSIEPSFAFQLLGATLPCLLYTSPSPRDA